jgi:hypothetical protein
MEIDARIVRKLDGIRKRIAATCASSGQSKAILARTVKQSVGRKQF